jgi:soluble lytic murein transglycosylase-like protein
MMKKILIIAFLLGVGTRLASADILVLTTGKTLRIKSYVVEGATVQVDINDHSEMTIPLEWIKEIRYSPDPPPEPEMVEVPPAAQMNVNLAFSDHVRSFAEKYDLDWRLVTAVMKVESNFNPRAVSRKGAQGLMQLMPDTSKLYRVRNPYDPQQNIEAGIKHLKKLMQRYDNKIELVLAAYNSGERAVDHFRGIPPFYETQQYVKKVLNFYRTGL